ncbi:MAG: hypothetical protein H6861_04520 [Rhodospirillales bacterium]|nr:hypothetical protein [Rhodospirillales bacterium]
MFSELSKILPLKPRHAEQTDTRQGIQRHDPDFERRRSKKDAEAETDIDEAGATVAVEALRIFLEDFLRNNPEETSGEANRKQPNPDMTAKQTSEESVAPPPNPQIHPAARAASAYASTAHAGEKNTVLFETTDAAGDGPALEISAGDIRTIHTLIEDLKLLEDAGIEILHIERAATFLDSLTGAVSKMKAAL